MQAWPQVVPDAKLHCKLRNSRGSTADTSGVNLALVSAGCNPTARQVCMAWSGSVGRHRRAISAGRVKTVRGSLPRTRGHRGKETRHPAFSLPVSVVSGPTCHLSPPLARQCPRDGEPSERDDHLVAGERFLAQPLFPCVLPAAVRARACGGGNRPQWTIRPTRARPCPASTRTSRAVTG